MRKSNETLSTGEASVWTAESMIDCIKHDPGFPAHRKTATCSAIRQACRWSGIEPATAAFTAPAMRKLLSEVSPSRAGVTKKSVQNVRSVIEFVLRHYDLERSSQFACTMSSWYCDLSGESGERHVLARIVAR